MTSRGDKYLGGRDFDKEITKLMKKSILIFIMLK